MLELYTNSFKNLCLKLYLIKILKFDLKKKKIAAIDAKPKTIKAPVMVSFFVGQDILKASCFTSCKNLSGFLIIHFFLFIWQERRDSNPQPPVLETGALPIELRSYLIIFVTTPAPTVLPPSLMAKFKFWLIAIGVINFTLNFPSSPGITISVPDGRVTSPVTSVVLK